MFSDLILAKLAISESSDKVQDLVPSKWRWYFGFSDKIESPGTCSRSGSKPKLVVLRVFLQSWFWYCFEIIPKAMYFVRCAGPRYPQILSGWSSHYLIDPLVIFPSTSMSRIPVSLRRFALPHPLGQAGRPVIRIPQLPAVFGLLPYLGQALIKCQVLRTTNYQFWRIIHLGLLEGNFESSVSGGRRIHRCVRRAE